MTEILALEARQEKQIQQAGCFFCTCDSNICIYVYIAFHMNNECMDNKWYCCDIDIYIYIITYVYIYIYYIAYITRLILILFRMKILPGFGTLCWCITSTSPHQSEAKGWILMYGFCCFFSMIHLKKNLGNLQKSP